MERRRATRIARRYPDKWEVDFGIDPKVLDQRIMQSAGNDAFAIQYGQIQPENLAVIFDDPEHTNAEYGGRAISGFDPYSRYYWIDVNKVKNVKIRQAMAVALDRAAIRLNIGGAFAGELRRRPRQAEHRWRLRADRVLDRPTSVSRSRTTATPSSPRS